MDFSDILDRSVDEIEEPKALPMGTWRFSITNGKIKPNNREGGPVGEALFMCKPLEAMDDVSEVELEVLGDQLDSTTAFHKIAIWERRDEWNIIRFLKLVGHELEEGDKLGDSVAKAKGYEFTAYVMHKPNPNDEDNPYVNLTDIKAVE